MAQRPSAAPQAGTGARAVSGGAACMLLVGDRVVLRANAPPNAEYVLFELGDIEVRASEPGRVREHGYQTTVGQARQRLAAVGITPEAARDCALAMHPVVSEAYARGPAVRTVARYLGPLELFQSDVFDAARGYHGVYLDLLTLANDADVPHAATTFQALYLAIILETEPEDATVFLSTDAWTKTRKPGERSHKRVPVAPPRDLASAVFDLAARGPKPQIDDHLPRADVIAFVRARADGAPDEDARVLYQSLERAIAVRAMPDKGPLADPGLWAVEQQLDAGHLEGIMPLIEDLERTRGRTPGTTYLRGRASLGLKLEPAKLIAERVSALALSMTSFQELSLLAAEAWLEAGESRRAMPYARDLVDAPNVDEGLMLRAQRLLARAVGAAPAHHKTLHDSIPAAPRPPSRIPPSPSQPPLTMPSAPPPPVSLPDPEAPRSFEPARSRVPTERGSPMDQGRTNTNPGIGMPSRPPPLPSKPPPLASKPPPVPSAIPRGNVATERENDAPRSARPPRGVKGSSEPPLRGAGSRLPGEPVSSLPPPLRRATAKPASADVLPGAPPPPLDLDLPPPDGASFTLDLPGPEAIAAKTPSMPPVEERASRRPRGGVLESRAPSAPVDPRAEPESDPEIPSPGKLPDPTKETLRGEALEKAKRASRPPPSREESPRPKKRGANAPEAMRPPMPTPIQDADLPPESRPSDRPPGNRAAITPAMNMGDKAFMRGASLPPFKVESPPPLLPKAPLLPKVGASDELVEHLSLPAGMSADARLDVLPKSILEARVQFTLLARELGLDFRLKRGIELRADVSAIEAMQAALLEGFPDHVVKTPDEAYEVRRHGALLSEILARRLDAEWIDISPNDLGYWSMIVPPDTRVWPFGRVTRLIQLGHKERDLVSYFFELQSRMRGR